MSTKDIANLTKQLNEEFKRSVYWNNYEKTCKSNRTRKKKYELLNASFQGVKRLFRLAYFIAALENNNPADDAAGIKNNKKYFLPRGEIKNYIVLIDGLNFYDQPINDKVNSMMKSEKYQWGMVMIIQLVVYWIMQILKTITD